MGYRLKVGKVSKADYELYKDLTEEEFYKLLDPTAKWDDEEEYWDANVSMYYPPFHTQLYEIGKYVDYSEGLDEFYTREHDWQGDSEFKIATKEWLKALINGYADDVHKWYKEQLDLIRNPKAYTKSAVETFYMEQARHWEQRFVPMFYLDEERTDGNITPSWSKEYAIFNLVEIYRNFDWENDLLIYSGW
jgi:hypothetical protein